MYKLKQLHDWHAAFKTALELKRRALTVTAQEMESDLQEFYVIALSIARKPTAARARRLRDFQTRKVIDRSHGLTW